MSVFHRIDVTEVWRASEKTLTGLDKMQPRSHEEHEHETHETHETEQPQAQKEHAGARRCSADAATQRRRRTRGDARTEFGQWAARASSRSGCGHRPARQADPPNTVRAMLCGLCACRPKLASPRRAKAGATSTLAPG